MDKAMSELDYMEVQVQLQVTAKTGGLISKTLKRQARSGHPGLVFSAV